MIDYNNRDIIGLLITRSGSAFFSKYVIIPALLSTAFCFILFIDPAWSNLSRYHQWPSWVYITSLAFAIVFRTNLACGRFFSGITHSYMMFSKWRDAFASLVSFIDCSIDKWEAEGTNPEAVHELACSKEKLLHWFSIMSALSVQTLQSNLNNLADNEYSLGSRFICKTACSESSGLVRFIMPHTTRLSEAQLKDVHAEKDMFLGHGRNKRAVYAGDRDGFHFTLQVAGTITEQEWDQIKRAEMEFNVFKDHGAEVQYDMVCLVLKWIEHEISRLLIHKFVLIPPPIISRVYQELGLGMLSYMTAKALAHLPFPFPLTQVIYYCLYVFLLLCPLLVRASIKEDDPPDFSRTWSMLLLNFFLCAGYACLNEIAVELEQPFGCEMNNWPLHKQHWKVCSDLEDILNVKTPQDFTPFEGLLDEFDRLNNDSLSTIQEDATVAPAEEAADRETAKVESHLLAHTQVLRDLQETYRDNLAGLHRRMRHLELLCALRAGTPPPSGLQPLRLPDNRAASGVASLLDQADSSTSMQVPHLTNIFAGPSKGHAGREQELQSLLVRSGIVNKRLKELLHIDTEARRGADKPVGGMGCPSRPCCSAPEVHHGTMQTSACCL